jgi:transposase
VHYLGIDVHSSASVWCLLDEQGEQLATGRCETSFHSLSQLATSLRQRGELVAGQEVGTQSYLVSDAFDHASVPVKSFNAAHLRIIAASRKKSDRRDAFWIARSLQTGMTPHPVYLPTGELRELRRLLSRRRAIQKDRNRWFYRARASLRSVGLGPRAGASAIRKRMAELLEHPDGCDTGLLETLGLAERMISVLDEEMKHVEGRLHVRTKSNDVVQRLMTIPGIGLITATTIYAVVGDIGRFRNARALCAYAGLVPTVRQSGERDGLGSITKEGSPYLRAALVQAAHVVTRLKGEKAAAFQATYARVRGSRGRRKIAIVAVARHLLRISYYVWRDEQPYDRSRHKAVPPPN